MLYRSSHWSLPSRAHGDTEYLYIQLRVDKTRIVTASNGGKNEVLALNLMP